MNTRKTAISRPAVRRLTLGGIATTALLTVLLVSGSPAGGSADGVCSAPAAGGYDPMTDYVDTLIYWHNHPTWWPDDVTTP